MKTSKVTTLVLMALVWWAFNPNNTTTVNPPVEAAVSTDKTGGIAINILP